MFQLGNQTIDSVELKALLVSKGIRVAKRIYSEFSGTFRLSKDPLECNTIILPDQTIVQLIDLSFHMEYIKQAINWNSLKQLKFLSQLKTNFTLDLDSSGLPTVFYDNQPVTHITFPDATNFYKKQTSMGFPFRGNSVLQGTEWLSFPLLWSCDFACSGASCQYCYSGGQLQELSRKKKKLPVYPDFDQVAEIVEYALVEEPCATSIQITGGSSFKPEAECQRISSLLEVIGGRLKETQLPKEVLVYTTPPADPSLLDQIFEAGASKISMSIEIWDEQRAKEIMPGKMKHVGRKRNLEALEYVVNTYGIGKACSNFIIGLESVDSTLEGAEYVASKGIIPIASIWIPFGRPVLGSMQAPDLTYYREVKLGLADIYKTYGLIPPGENGLNVCMCRDIYLQNSNNKLIA